MKQYLWPTKIAVAVMLAGLFLTEQNLQAGFTPIIEPAAQAQWRAGPDTPEVANAGNGIKFLCVFNAKIPRVYWDYPVSVDLSKCATIELELFCPDQEAVQSVGLYLQSGKGWYLWIKPILKSGRQKFFLQVKDAATEGRPAGWNKITGARISFQNNASAADTFVVLNGLKAGTSGIVLIKGTSSAPDNGEQSVTQKTTARISKWLADAGVAHSVLDDEDIAGGRVRSAAIIILPYNPQISDREMSQLEKLAANGAKLIVFYGSNSRLAELLGMKLGKYRAASAPGQWSSFVFNRSAPPGMPAQVIQESGNIYTVFPDSEKSKITAYWQDAAGKTLSDPAWVQSEKGAWMTHILLGEDSEKKKKMLVAILGQYEPGVWKEANQNSNGFKNVILREGITNQHLRRQGRQPNGTADGTLVIYQTSSQICHMPAQHRPGLQGNGLKTNEFRGVWNHSGLGLYPGNWNKTCQLLADSGLTAVFPNMLWPGTAHYPSKFAGQSEQAKKYGDQMAQCVQAARSAGLEVHVWKVCWNLERAPKEFTESMREQGRLQRNIRGESLNWLCPSAPANISLELNAVMEVLRNYDIDGVHLDYIRYPDADSCYCAGCRRRYKQWSGQLVASWPADVSSGKQRENYRAWRSLQITEFVRSIRREMKKIKPRAKLSAAVYPKYPECIESIGQDWGLWLMEGIVDFVCPMDYLPTVSAFRETLDRQLVLPNSKQRVYPGIGATLSEGDLAPEIFLGQIQALREYQTGGFMLFDLNPVLAADFLPLIMDGAR